jgi:hypothetical protein
MHWGSGRDSELSQISNWLSNLLSRTIRIVEFSDISISGGTWTPSSSESVQQIQITVDDISSLPLTENNSVINFTISGRSNSDTVTRYISSCHRLDWFQEHDVLVVYIDGGSSYQDEVERNLPASRVVISNNQSPDIIDLINNIILN